MGNRPARTLAEHERHLTERMFRDHGHQLERYAEQDAAEAAAPISGHSRHAAEMDRRARLHREIEAELRRPLHVACLSPAERQAIHLHERLRLGRPR